MNWHQITLEYLRVVTWPITVLIIGFLFRIEIKELFKRINEVQVKDLKVLLPSQQLPKDDVKKEVQEEIKETIEEKKKENIKKELTTSSNTKEELTKQITNLSTQVAILQSALLFERIYGSIFGTQITLLEYLRNNLGGLSYTIIANVYEGWRKNDDVLKNYALSDYIKYLESAQLISFSESNNQRIYIITTRGLDFLDYIEKSGYLKNKLH